MQLRFIPRPAGISSSQARDVNDSGFVVGEYGGSIGDFGFIYNLNTSQYVAQLPTPIQGGICSINAINASNVVCGTRTITGPPEYKSTAFKWSAATGFQDLGLIGGESTSANDLNDANALTGTMSVNSTSHPFLWENGTISDLGTLAGLFTIPYALNRTNQVVGQSATIPPTLQPHAFSWSVGVITDLGVIPGDTFSRAFALNDQGTITGLSRDSKGNLRAVVWYSGQIHDLNSFLPANAGFFLFDSRAISADGTIVASGYVLPGGIGMSCLMRPVNAPSADVINDCKVNVNDLLLVINEWGKRKSVADINDDGIVGVIDLYEVIRQWTY